MARARARAAFGKIPRAEGRTGLAAAATAESLRWVQPVYARTTNADPRLTTHTHESGIGADYGQSFHDGEVTTTAALETHGKHPSDLNHNSFADHNSSDV